MARRNVIKTSLLLVILTVVTLGLAHQSLLRSAASWLNVATAPQHSDYVFVLNGDANVRPFIGAALIKAGLASEALIVPTKELPPSDQQDSPTRISPPSHELSRLVMIHQGVAADKIRILDGQCTSTFDEVELMFQYLNKLSDDSATVSVVTSNFHTRRTRWTCSRVFGEQMNRLRFVAAPTEGFDETNWWRVEDGFMTYGTEFLKFGFYAFRYGKGLWVCGAAIALVSIAILSRRFWWPSSDPAEPSYA